jgi:hypothetical protein
LQKRRWIARHSDEAYLDQLLREEVSSRPPIFTRFAFDWNKTNRATDKYSGLDKAMNLGKYVEPRAQIVVTTQTLFARWLRAHKDWWGKNIKNVPQQMAKALSDESLYTQAIANGSAVVKFSPLPIATPTGTTFAFAMLAGRTQSELPGSADEVIVAAIANGKVYVAEGSIEPKVRIAACLAGKKGEPMDEKVRERSEAAYARCFAQRAPQQPSFAQATKQAQALLASALGR